MCSCVSIYVGKICFHGGNTGSNPVRQWPKIKDTVNLEHARRHYYESHDMVNPTRIVPMAPDINWDEAHNRESLS